MRVGRLVTRYGAAVSRERVARPSVGTFQAGVAVAQRNLTWRIRRGRERAQRSLAWRFRRGRERLGCVLGVALLGAAVRFGLESCARRERLGTMLKRLERTDAAFASWWRAVELGSENVQINRDCAYYFHGRGWWDAENAAMRRTIELRERLAEQQGFDPRRRLADELFTLSLGCITFFDTIAKQKALAANGPETVLLAHPDRVSNSAYLDLFRDFFPVVDDPAEIARLKDQEALLRMEAHTWRAPDGRLHYFADAASEVEEQWQAQGREPLLRLTEAEIEAGWKQLASRGIPRGAWFAVLHVREVSYDAVRNADLATYHRAVAAILERGGWVIRIGDRTGSRLPEHERVLDYALEDGRPPSTDLFLLSQARFVVGTESGPAAVAGTFGVPAVTTNWTLNLRNWYRNHVSVTKLYRHKGGPYLTFEEALSSPVAFLPLAREDLDAYGVTIVDNSAEEIEEAVVEMLDLLEFGPSYTAEDDELQRRFYASQPPLEYPLPRGGARIGREFLRRHEDLLS